MLDFNKQDQFRYTQNSLKPLKLIMKKILALAFIISTTVSAQEPLRKFDEDLLKNTQIPIKINPKEFKKLVDSAKKTDSNVYDIVEENLMYQDENFSKSRYVTYLPYGGVIAARGNNYVTLGTRYDYSTKDWLYMINKKSYDCEANFFVYTQDTFLNDGSFLATHMAIDLLPKESPAYKQYCIENPNKKQS